MSEQSQPSKAFITGVAGKTLHADEKSFISREQPWGVILFARNIGSKDEVRGLTASLREAAGREDMFVFVDQEGGRVQRLRAPLAPDYPSAALLGKIYQNNQEAGLRAAWIMSRLHAFDLMSLGINANCLPVLDVPVEGAHDVIGARAYGHHPDIVTQMGGAAAKGLRDGGVLPVMKHIPGHGRAFNDTHKELARVTASLAELEEHDFIPFKALKDLPAAMSAHVIFDAIDSTHPATMSTKIVKEIIRAKIGFDGLLMSDDLSMKGLAGDAVGHDFKTLAGQVYAAGCDMVLHCNGDMTEMVPVAQAAPVLTGDALKRVDAIFHYMRAPQNDDEQALREEFHLLTAGLQA